MPVHTALAYICGHGSHQSAGRDLAWQPETNAHTSNPIDRISTSPLLLVTTPSRSL